jgi:hypothetical protein
MWTEPQNGTAKHNSWPVFGHEWDVSVKVDFKGTLLAVEWVQDIVELGNESPEGACGDNEQEDTVHLGRQSKGMETWTLLELSWHPKAATEKDSRTRLCRANNTVTTLNPPDLQGPFHTLPLYL